ncbi:hypothetical protein [Oceanospirillum linum]|uniref:Uncharacterized protein n=1 Tax=Oceanospirillum linum TaxID=966 RepID=A0A1T1HF17_OCELI|nr:hypothetical protein [Oceanospirillum linum]OOV88468.1 hypothetical protein BTA35_0202895 [Oceanospirillum linum]SEF57415.1 tRNA nucleotidyltransferase (CCA-adding enzyme) [Oleiphilus messinensis]SMP05915.1 tRNA nucleotidyltransferase (CCA-adding enzyme) [Oceanospirillum linum]
MSQFLSSDDDSSFLSGEVYLVGGPVRDELLGVEAYDRDWLVVGAIPEELKAAGFVQVGKDFPVFLHPDTKEEYALARTERKTGKGYQGFVCHTSPDVTLEEDLMRRDFTINAMAKDINGNIHDPYGGLKDLELKLLRHVSPAFAEDPLRVLRGARFLARFYRLGFSIAPETLQLMAELVAAEELEQLSAERVWSETEKALQERNPEQYLAALQRVGGLNYWFKELSSQHFYLPEHLSEKDKTERGLLNWGWLLHELTPDAIESLCHRIKAPKHYLGFALLVQKFWSLLNTEPEQDALLCLSLLESSGAFRQGGFFEAWLSLWQPDKNDIKEWWQSLAEAMENVTAKKFVQQGLKGPAIGAAIKAQRLKLIDQAFRAL